MIDKIFKAIAWLHGGGKDTDEVCREWHSFINGFGEGFTLFVPTRFPVTSLALTEMAKEFHYYVAGRAIQHIRRR